MHDKRDQILPNLAQVPQVRQHCWLVFAHVDSATQDAGHSFGEEEVLVTEGGRRAYYALKDTVASSNAGNGIGS
jgi:hypothetical protein